MLEFSYCRSINEISARIVSFLQKNQYRYLLPKWQIEKEDLLQIIIPGEESEYDDAIIQFIPLDNNGCTIRLIPNDAENKNGKKLFFDCGWNLDDGIIFGAETFPHIEAFFEALASELKPFLESSEQPNNPENDLLDHNQLECIDTEAKKEANDIISANKKRITKLALLWVNRVPGLKMEEFLADVTNGSLENYEALNKKIHRELQELEKLGKVQKVKGRYKPIK